MAVNSTGAALTWKLALNPKFKVIKRIKGEIIMNYGCPGIIVTDGNPTYQQVLIRLRYEGYHAIHRHKDLRNQIIIQKCVFQRNQLHDTEDLVGMNHDVFVDTGTKQNWWLSQSKRLPPKGGKRSRQKGSKNLQKRDNDPEPISHFRPATRQVHPQEAGSEKCVLGRIPT